MSLGNRLGLSLAPIFLRVSLGVTFLWAGLGKGFATEEISAEDAAILANAGVMKPSWAAPSPSPDKVPAPKEGAGTPKPAEPPPAAVPPPTTTPEQPKAPAEQPKGASKSMASADAEFGAAIVPARWQPAGALMKYKAEEFPNPSKTQRVHMITLMLIKSATPSARADGTKPMALVPEFATQGPWPSVLAWSATAIEIAGGTFLLVGFFTRVSAFGLVVIMLNAMWLTTIGPAIQSGTARFGFLPSYGPWSGEWQMAVMQLLCLCGAASLIFLGAGALSLDRAVFGRSKPEDPLPGAPKQK